MKRRVDFYDHDEDGNQIDYTVYFTVTPYDKGDYYQPPKPTVPLDADESYFIDNLMCKDDVTDELDKMIDEAIEKAIERHN